MRLYSFVTPAKAGVQGTALPLALDPRFRGGDKREIAARHTGGATVKGFSTPMAKLERVSFTPGMRSRALRANSP
jgi:hypothetical protein